MRTWFIHNRRRLTAALAVYAVMGTFFAGASVAAGFAFLRNADSVTSALDRTTGSVSGALAMAQVALDSGARSIESLGGALDGSAEVVTRAAGFAGQAASAAEGLADALYSAEFFSLRPFEVVARPFRELGASAREIEANMATIQTSLAATAGTLPELAGNLRQLGVAIATINSGLDDLPGGPELADQLRMAAILLFAVASWFLFPGLVALGAAVVLLRATGRTDRRSEATS